MKKSAIFLLIVSAGLCAGTSAFAEDEDYAQAMQRRQPGKDMGMKGGPHASMVALMDGSIVVLSGNKLTKYDSDLNVLKEAEIKGGSMPPKPPMDEMKTDEPPVPPFDSTSEPFDYQPPPPAQAPEPSPETPPAPEPGQ